MRVVRLLLCAACLLPLPAAAAELLVFAAASLRPVLESMLHADAPEVAGVKASYAASSQLARQIDAGAPAAVFISADQAWMDFLAERDRIVADTRVDLLGNALVLIAPRDSTTHAMPAPDASIVAALGDDGRLAIAEPNSVPAGRYAKAALSRLGVWDRVATRIVAAADVRAALNFVARGEAPLGIVYRTDAESEPAVRVIATFPADSHPPVIYAAAVTAQEDSPRARALLAWLQAPAQREAFRAFGFDAPPRP